MNAILHPPLLTGISPLLGRLTGFNETGQPLIVAPVDISENTLQAASLCLLTHEDIGAEVLLAFVGDHFDHPVILGKLYQRPLCDTTPEPAEAHIDGKRILLQAEERLELKCGKAHLSLGADGRIHIHGGYILNHATGINRIRGAAVKIN